MKRRPCVERHREFARCLVHFPLPGVRGERTVRLSSGLGSLQTNIGGASALGRVMLAARHLEIPRVYRRCFLFLFLFLLFLFFPLQPRILLNSCMLSQSSAQSRPRSPLLIKGSGLAPVLVLNHFFLWSKASV